MLQQFMDKKRGYTHIQTDNAEYHVLARTKELYAPRARYGKTQSGLLVFMRKPNPSIAGCRLLVLQVLVIRAGSIF